MIAMPLTEVREKIDALDGRLTELLIERMKLSRDVARQKRDESLPLTDRARERAILTDVTGRAGSEFEEYLKVLFSVLFDMSKSYQVCTDAEDGPLAREIAEARRNTPAAFPKRAVVACQGIEGAYSQQAAERMFAIPEIIYFRDFEAIFRAVSQGFCQYGILPIENSVHGSVLPVYDLMKDYRFSIVRSVKRPINHSLLAKESTSLADVREVLSHPQALGQCARYLADHPAMTAIEAENTAVAARQVAQSPRGDLAAIASRECAEIYGLKPLADGIENGGGNFTRFICISRTPEIYPGANRISLILTLPHRPGTLYSTLARFASLGLNLTKLESRPIPGRDFEFLFYFELETPELSDELIRLLDHFRKTLPQFAFLGCYGEV